MKSTIEELQEMCDNIPKETQCGHSGIKELEERIAVYYINFIYIYI